MIKVKLGNDMECVERKMLKLPNIQKCEMKRRVNTGFTMTVEMADGFEFEFDVYPMEKVYPSTVLQFVEKKFRENRLSVLVAPHISERTAEICQKNHICYFDYSGNCWFVGHSIYLSEKGNKNLQPEKNRAVSIFTPSSVVSSNILRELFADVHKAWRLKYLAEKLDCSIGQVSKVMNYLQMNAWVKKTVDGYIISEPEMVLQEWARSYGEKRPISYSCYSLDDPAVFESRLRRLKQEMGIESYLTGISGGVRYTPVVRYNKVHLYLAPEDLSEAADFLLLKEVKSGGNVVIYPLEDPVYIKDCRLIEGNMVVSPVQIYLDSVQLAGRGEELAEAVMRKEILK